MVKGQGKGKRWDRKNEKEIGRERGRRWKGRQ